MPWWEGAVARQQGVEAANIKLSPSPRQPLSWQEQMWLSGGSQQTTEPKAPRPLSDPELPRVASLEGKPGIWTQAGGDPREVVWGNEGTLGQGPRDCGQPRR